MATRLTLLCAGATASSRTGGFPAPDEPLDEHGKRKAAALRLRGPRPDLVVTSPSRAAIDTAHAAGLDTAVDVSVADLRYGDWSGRALAEIETRDAPALLAWFADPVQATPGGESMAKLLSRVGAWMDEQAGRRPVADRRHARRRRAGRHRALPVRADRFDDARGYRAARYRRTLLSPPMATSRAAARVSRLRIPRTYRPGEGMIGKV